MRAPEATDGASLHRLIRSCPPLDENSMYCNLLQCTHFAATSVIGEMDNQLVSAISGYLLPGRPDTLFVWQVAVGESARGQGLGRRMLNHLLARPACAAVTHLETTVTESNRESWGMFEGFAGRLNAPIVRRALFEEQTHFAGEHESEVLARIGPLPGFAQRTGDNIEPSKEKKA